LAILASNSLGQSFVLGEGLSANTDDILEVAYLLAIEGIPYLWCTDHTGGVLLGSGSNSWISLYEGDAQFTGHEDIGQRQVVAGLRMPRQLSRGELNPKTGTLETTTVTFDLLDVDGFLPRLFASEGKDADVLSARVAPGTTAIAGNLTIQGGDVTPAAEKYIGLERLGPAGERAWFNPFPWQGIGHHHQVANDIPNGPPKTLVSEEPLQFAGRRCALYRLTRRIQPGSVSHADWAPWHEQGGPEWFGVLRDTGEYRANATWSIGAFGPESLLRRRMGTFDSSWTRVSGAEVTLTDEQRQFAIAFFTQNGSDAITTYDSIGFGTVTLPASGTKEDFIAAIASEAQDVFDNTTPSDWGSSTMATEDFGSTKTVQLSFTSSGVEIERDGTEGTVAMVGCVIAMHETLWRLLGYDLVAQDIGLYDELQSERDIPFRHLEPNEDRFYNLSNSTNNGERPDHPGYWSGYFTTRALGFGMLSTDDGSKDNDGNPRRYKPLDTATENVILRSPGAEQQLRLSASQVYIEPDPTIDADGYDGARYFAFRGKRVVGSIGEGQVFDDEGDPVDQLDSEDFVAVAECAFGNDGAYGTVDTSTAAAPVVYNVRWRDTRAFGADYDQIEDVGEWAARSNGDYSIEIAPLHCYGYRANEAGAFERAASVFAQLLLSTGTAGGWSGGTYSPGDNAPTTDATTFWLNDATSSSLGLGVPHQLVQDPDAILSAFDEVPGGVHGALSRVRYAYSEPFESHELIESLLRPRGLAMSLRGGRFGAMRLGLFTPADVDHVLTETSVAVPLNNPEAEDTQQRLRATGAIDRVEMEVGRDPATGEALGKEVATARDPSAHLRRGDFVEELSDPGLRPPAWFGNWLEPFRQLQGIDRAGYLAKRQFLVQMTLHAAAGHNVWPGDRVSLTHQALYNADGSEGINGALGHVLSVTARPGDQTYQIEVLVHSDQLRIPLFGPIARVIAGINTSNLTIAADADFLNHGNGPDALRFLRPWWLPTGTAARVCLLGFNRVDWTLYDTDTDTVDSVNGNVLTLTNGFSGTFHRNHDYYLVFAGFDDQDEGSWPRTTGLPIVEDNHEFGSGPTEGWPYVDG